jgi:YD repeat-containing protein
MRTIPKRCQAPPLASTTDRLEHANSFGYDEVGRRVSATDPLDATTAFTFDAAGNMATLTDPVGNQTTWSYDHAGRVVEEVNELDDSRTFAYNADGDVSSKTDRNGRVIEYAYDLLRRCHWALQNQPPRGASKPARYVHGFVTDPSCFWQAPCYSVEGDSGGACRGRFLSFVGLSFFPSSEG